MSMEFFAQHGIGEGYIAERDEPIDPVTEEVLYADELEDHMLVLTAPDGRYRWPATARHFPAVEKCNRWCMVTKVRAEADGIYFIGIYDDGQQHLRRARPTDAWVVKSSTIPARDDTVETDEEVNHVQ